MREIGGYLELETLVHNEYYANAIALNTARNALVYLVKAKGIKKVYLPFYLCDCVYAVCDREHIEYEFYHIDKKFFPVFQKILGEDEYLYIVNYFGQLTKQDIQQFKDTYKNIIIDNVQAFFAEPVSGVDTICSCRKFFGVPDGAYLISDITSLQLEIDISKDRMKHLLGRFEGKSASDYYREFQENDSSFSDLCLMYMSKFTHNILGAIDYDDVIVRRNRNWKVLHDALGDKNRLQVQTTYAPYMYPLYCENGMEIKKKLAEMKIFVPTLWPNVLELEGCELEKDYTENIVPLPIDQRYSEGDMQRVVTELLNVLSK